MKTMDLRNWVLSKNRKTGFDCTGERGHQIVACGLMGEPNRYWIELEDGTRKTGLTRIHPVVTYE